jgi:membrane associated rhomboid family serine protease
MLALLAEVSDNDLSTLLVVLAALAFLAAIYCAVRVSIEAAVVAALIGVLILIFGV